ncbi:DEKNAAC100162 [Brettanomyces naardenensis]|uniref:DEKNAAC100162 n=1 Tax=Brettanomyces naardenensis TaxID=13370 RepID=A0A448YFR3_BRENA|nr:DEKNAAC100162 [Brettanomyces naardenensis]
MPLGRTAKHLGHTMRNLVSSLIEHESVTTTLPKAKMAQGMIDNMIVKTKKSTLPANALKSKLYGELYNQEKTVPKLMNELTERYKDRNGGFTRILKLEPRIGDNAPQAILELVDNGEREMKFWYIAKTVARLELQGQPLDDLTEKNVRDLLLYRKDGDEEFRRTVELCKKEFFDDSEEELKNLPRMKSNTNGFHRTFRNYKVVPREEKPKE